MSPVGWAFLAVLCSAFSAAIVYLLMRSRAEVLLSKQREELAEARAALNAQRESLQDSLRNAEDATRRKAMDEFIADIRVEERHYIREHKILFVTRKCLVRQERIFFRNLPLSNWVEQEMPIEEGADVDKLAQAMTVFTPEGMIAAASKKLLQ
jgi:multidrug efflux pump subunit AcrA (membrane-fusion protein)